MGEEEAEALMRVRARAIDDAKPGWVTLRGGNLLPWSPNYRCASATAIHDALTAEGAATVRRLEAGEEVELIEGPRMEPTLGVLRLRGRATKDGAVGWITIAGNQGKTFLECIPPE